ncbi:UDP-glycosyltransferase 73C5 [Platanthera guangdongensis]|uniref:UDP-glycosyltransferase 73C5 n=1 Tax=Platanthera guangdongensis TaxID=2320717 RepID=A0ABR2MG24_9ASPA
MDKPKLHLVVIPLLAQGHMIPMADLSLLLAARGARISLITTPLNAIRLRGVANVAADSGLPLRLVELPFPCADAGLPVGCENVDLIPREDLFTPFFKSLNLLAEPLKLYLRAEPTGPTCIIADQCMPWAIDVACDLGLPRFVFQAPSCFFLLCTLNLSRHNFYQSATNWREPFTVPELPDGVGRFQVTKLTAQRFFDWPGQDVVQRHVEKAEAAADGIVLNTFEALEPWCVQDYRRAAGKEVWPVGPVSGFHKDLAGKASRGSDRGYIYASGAAKWLEGRMQGSVMFVSFGSISLTRMRQMVEIGEGLAAMGRPFIWAVKQAVKPAEKSEVGERWLSEFEKRTEGRGLVIRGWAPQALILNHPAVAGFVTHCGWNSTVEAVEAGVVMATWPHLADQFLNETLVVEVLGIGVRVGVKSPAYHLWGEEEVVLVGREMVRSAVERVMDGGMEGDERRRRAAELGEKARKAMEGGGSSFDNLNCLIEHATKLAAMKNFSM